MIQKAPLFVLLMFVSLLSYGQTYQYMIDQGTYTIASIESEANQYFEINGTGKGSGYKQFQRWLYVAKRDIDENGFKRSNKSQMKSLRKYRLAAANKRKGKGDQALGTSLTGNWEEVGPTYWSATSGWNSGVGRISSIGVDPNNANHIIVGSPTGGVWKSSDAGINWSPLADNFQTLDVWSLAISPHNANHYLWGTRSEVYKSTDAGATWTSSGHAASGDVIRIIYHPTDPNIVLSSSSSGGVYRSTNAGDSWTKVSSAGSSIYDLEFKPGDPSIVYASGTVVYKSTDAGVSFSTVSGPWSTGRKMMAVTADNSSVVYIVEESSGAFGGLYKSTNSGSSFTAIRDGSINYFGYDASGGDTDGQAPRDMDIIVSPSNENEVHVAGIQTWKSTNGGTSFSLTSYWTHNGAASRGVGYCHADVDIMVYQGSRIYVGSDGGFYTSDNQAASFEDKTTGMGLRQYYRIGISETDPNVVTGGAQDNGTCVMRGASREFKFWLGADGMEGFVDWSNPNTLYGTTQSGSLYKSTNQGNSYSGITSPDGSGAWVTPFEQDPTNANTVYAGFNEVWKSTVGGGSWTQISTFGGGTLDELKIAKSNNQYMYVADGAVLSRTTNGGSSWTTLSGTAGTVNWIAVDPEDEQRVAVVTSSTVYVSTDAGATWTNYTKNLPGGTSYYCAVWEKGVDNGLYVGGNGFISYINDKMTSYVDFLTGLPNVRVYELEIQNVSKKIFAGTYGRGLWESDLYGSSGKNHDAGTVAINNVSSTICGSDVEPIIEINNSGDSTLTSVDIKIYLDDVLVKTVNHSTNLTTGQSEEVTISGVSFSVEGTIILKAEVSNPNGNTDENAVNDSESMAVVVTFGQPNSSQNVGPVDNTFGAGANYNNDNGLLFTVLKPLVLETVKVYAEGAGDRVIEIENSGGTVIFTKTVTLSDGENTVQMDASLTNGIDYRIDINGSANLYRNSDGPSYPYTIADLISITSSTAAGVELQYYYFFYDWQVREEGCAVVTSVIVIDGNTRVFPNPTEDAVSFEMRDAKQGDKVNVEVIDALGRSLHKENISLNGKVGTVSLGYLPAGNYYLQLRTDSQSSVNKITIAK